MTTTTSDKVKASETSSEAAELTPTPADQWPANEPRVVQLPSGAVASLRRVQWYSLYRTSMPKAMKVLVEKRSRPGEKLSEDESLRLLHYAVAQAMVDPPGSLTRRKGTVYVPDMDEADKVAVVAVGGLP
jgi:hypothetical protein